MNAAKRFPANFLFLVTPLPIQATDRITRLEKSVWSAVYSQETINSVAGIDAPTHLSNSQIALTVGCDRSRASRAISRLVEVGLLKVRGKTTSTFREHGTREVTTLWPKWLVADADEFLRARERGKGIDLDADEVDEGGDERETASPVASDERSPLLVTNGHQASDESSPLLVTNGQPTISKRSKEKDRYTRRGLDETGSPGCQSVGADGRTTGRSREVEEPNVDDDSLEANAKLEGDRNRRREGREERSARRKRRRPVEEGNLREPSRRPVFGRWREKSRDGADWAARDVVGYFVCRFLEVFGRETEEFFATTDDVLKRVVPNVRKYVDRWWDGDYRRARSAVDKILREAEPRGLPVKLAYFFTPVRESTMRRLDEPVKSGREEEPWRRNDRFAADPENYREIVEDFRVRRKAQLAARAAGRSTKEMNGG